MKTWKDVLVKFIDDPVHVFNQAFTSGPSFGHEGDDDDVYEYQSFFGWGAIIVVIFILMTAWIVTQILRIGKRGGGANFEVASQFTAAGVAFCVFPVFGYIPALVFFVIAEYFLCLRTQQNTPPRKLNSGLPIASEATLMTDSNTMTDT